MEHHVIQEVLDAIHRSLGPYLRSQADSGVQSQSLLKVGKADERRERRHAESDPELVPRTCFVGGRRHERVIARSEFHRV